MSSHRLSASGDRQYSLTAGGGAFTAMQVPSKTTDRARITAQSFGRIVMQLPAAGVRLERYRHRDSESVVQFLIIAGVPYDTVRDGETVQVRGPVGITFDAEPGEVNSWPHTNIDVRRHEEGDTGLIGFATHGQYDPMTGESLDIPPTVMEPQGDTGATVA
jgi:hypothetical protein